tara:strand:- start:1673 stop:2839 length:1167 start_codon:yes stop_codon:yes gene_type:complete
MPNLAPYIAQHTELLKDVAQEAPKMGAFYRIMSRPLLGLQDSEKAHARSLRILGTMEKSSVGRGLIRTLSRRLVLESHHFGMDFPNPIGLAAGMDKKAQSLLGWQEMGFGWMEYGGITAVEQDGNPRPRMFRSRQDRALINRMGFNNLGAEKMAEILQQRRDRNLWPSVPVGANIGRSKSSTNEDALKDYLATMQALEAHADIFIVNVSSPNTPGLRNLQSGGQIENLLAGVTAWRNEHSKNPILVKIAPDLSDEQIGAIAKVAVDTGIDGIVATNTTTSRNTLKSSAKFTQQNGGLSGRPLRKRSTEVISILYQQLQGSIPIIGVGGIDSGESAWEKLTAGASLLQIYSGLIFEGPGLPGAINRSILQRMELEGITSLNDVIGKDVV